MTSVAVVGVRNRGCIRANQRGIAPCDDMARTARAVGMIVVWHEAAVELSTHRTSSLPGALPSIEVAMARSTSVLCESRKAGPAYVSAATLATAKIATSISVAMTAARPRVRAESFAPSFTLRQPSQPQYLTTASRNEFNRRPNDPDHGLSHAAYVCAELRSACPVPPSTRATIAKTASAPTSM